MRIALLWAVGLSGLLAITLFPAGAGAQEPAQLPAVRVPIVINGVASVITIPANGSATVASYNRLAESRSEFGPPIAGKVPYVNRAFRNVGTGRSVLSRRVGVTVRVINLRDEEFRQTGFRSP